MNKTYSPDMKDEEKIEWYKANHISPREKYRLANKPKINALQRKWLAANPDKRKQYKKTYWEKRKPGTQLWAEERIRRLTREAVNLGFAPPTNTAEELAAIYQPTCQLCGGDHRMAMDHCHTTGQVRGMLCRRCNQGIGLFGDNPALLRAAATYLEKKTPRIHKGN
jgi:hypothetical protein